VRLRYAYIVKCESVVKDVDGNVTEIRCTYDPATRSGSEGEAGRKVKGTIHWVSAGHALSAEVRLYDRLFKTPNPGAEDDVTTALNPDSLQIAAAALEPSLASAVGGDRFQFERNGYFYVDPQSSGEGQPVFNRTVTLRDSWAKIEQQAAAALE
jgi:glutaminyl-tRNA synthetase